MKLELGKRYVRRDGEIAGPLENSGNEEYPLLDPREGYTFTENGKYIGKKEDALDLVSEYIEEAVEAVEAVEVKDVGGPAFPESASGPYPNGEIVIGRPGMTLRDWFAGMAMQGWQCRDGLRLTTETHLIQ